MLYSLLHVYLVLYMYTCTCMLYRQNCWLIKLYICYFNALLTAIFSTVHVHVCCRDEIAGSLNFTCICDTIQGLFSRITNFMNFTHFSRFVKLNSLKINLIQYKMPD